MEDLGYHTKTIGISKFSGIFIGLTIVFVVALVPLLPSWLMLLAAYPFITSLVDIVLYFRG